MQELLQSILGQVSLSTVLDIAITAVLIYWLFSLIRGTQAVRLVVGVTILILVYVLAEALGLRLLRQVLEQGAVVALFALVVVFQPELRRALDRIGRVGSFAWLHTGAEMRTIERVSDEVASAVALARDGKAAGGAHDLAEYITRLAAEMGGVTETRLKALAVDAHNEFLRCVEEGAPAPQPRSWLRLRGRGRRGRQIESDTMTTLVDSRIGDRVRELLVQRGRAHAAITDLALALEALAGTTR